MQVGKEELIELLSEHTEEILRHKDAQFESVLHELKVIAEVQIEHSRKFEVINRKLDEHTRILNAHSLILMDQTRKFEEINRRLDEHSLKLIEHDRKFEEINFRLDEHTFKLDEHTCKIDAIMEMVAENTENVVVIRSMLDCKVGTEPFKLLSGRVMAIEKKLLANN
jgi:hypothetical protein